MIKKIKFRTRLFLLITLSFFCAIIVAVVGIAYMQSIQGAIEDINKSVVIPMEKLNKMSASLKTIESAMRDSSINRYSAVYKAEKDIGFLALSDSLREFEDSIGIPEVKAHIDVIYINIDGFSDVCDDILAAANSEDMAEVTGLLNGRYRAHRDIIGHSITSLSALTREHSVTKQEYAEKLAIQAVQICVILIILSVIVLLPVFNLALRSVIEPLKSMAQMAKSISDGDFGHEIPYVDSNDELGTLADSLRSMTQHLSTRDRLLHATSRAAQELLSVAISKTSFDDSVNKAMAILGESVGVDRVYIWHFHESPDPETNPGLHTTQLYEWSLGAEPQQDLEICKNRPVLETMPTWIGIFESGGCINNLVRNMPALEQEQLSPQGIISIMTAPIVFDGELWGFIGFDNCHSEYIWSEAEENILKTAGMIVGAAICNNEIEKALSEASSANQAKSEFLANMSHEIRTPLNAIIGMAELAVREAETPSVKEYLHTIWQAGTNLLDIVNDILDFSKIESGNIEIVEDDYLLSSLINDVVHITKTKVHEKRLRFIVNIDNNIPDALYGDVKRIRQIILNLLTNAVKYTEKGYVSLSLSGSVAESGSVALTFKVADSGIGISPQNIDSLFEKFTRFNLEKNRNIEGTGLGLAITKGLIEAMNGTIDIRSIIGEGSAFTVKLDQGIRGPQKLAVVHNANELDVLVYERRGICITSIRHTMDGLGINFKIVLSAAEFYHEINRGCYTHVFLASVLYERVKEEYPDIRTNAKVVLIAEYGEIIAEQNMSVLTTPIFSIPVANLLNGDASYTVASIFDIEEITKIAPGAKILSVDDVATNLLVLEGLLQPYRMQITSCKSGMEAIGALKKMPYDLVFMDHMMPEMDGVETTKRIKEMAKDYPYLSEMPVIALSANAVLGSKEMFLENGFNDFISKPIDTQILHDVLTKWIPGHKWLEP